MINPGSNFEEDFMKGKLVIIGVLVVILIVICVGMGLAGISVLRSTDFSAIRFGGIGGNSFSTQADESKQITVAGTSTLSVDTPYGFVDVTAGDTKEISIQAHKTAWGATLQDAQDTLQKMQVVVTQDGDKVTITVKKPVEVDYLRIVPSGGGVDFTIVVPADCAVTANSSSGNVRLRGTTRPAKLTTDYGEASAENVQAAVELRSSSGDVLADKIAAGSDAIVLHTDYGDATVTNSKAGSLDASSSSGKIRMEASDVTGTVSLKSDYGDIDFSAGSAGVMNVNTSSGRINGIDTVITGEIKAHSDHGDVEVRKVAAASYDLSSSSGSVTLTDAKGHVRAQSDYGDIRVVGEQVVADFSTSSGSIEFTGSLGAEDSRMTTDYGSVRVTLPADAAFQFDLRTDFGNVRSTFAATLDSSNTSTHLTGKVGAGGPKLTVHTSSGDIALTSK
jgi:DUF4097 and DUF4098 domain-containing protein YvlB